MLFDWLVTGHILEVNPAHAVRGPKHVVRKGKTPVLSPEKIRQLLDSIEPATLIGLRDRALMTYTFARVGAAVKMRVEIVSSGDVVAGCGCRRKAARTSRCPAITVLMNTCIFISSRPASSTI